MQLSYDEFIADNNFGCYYNFNVSNDLNFPNALKRHVLMLESMSSGERVSVIKETENFISIYENIASNKKSIKEKKEASYTNSRNLDKLHHDIEVKEIEIDDFYQDMKTTLDKEKLTFEEYQNLRRETQIKAKIHQMQLDYLLNITLAQLKTYNKSQDDFKEAKTMQKDINDLLEKARKYLNEAKILQIKNAIKIKEDQNVQKHSEQFGSLQKCVEGNVNIKEINTLVIPHKTFAQMKREKMSKKILYKKDNKRNYVAQMKNKTKNDNLKNMSKKNMMKSMKKDDLPKLSQKRIVNNKKIQYIQKRPQAINKSKSNLKRNDEKSISERNKSKKNQDISKKSTKTKIDSKPKSKPKTKGDELKRENNISEQKVEIEKHSEQNTDVPKGNVKTTNIGCCKSTKSRPVITNKKQITDTNEVKKDLIDDTIISDNKIKPKGTNVIDEKTNKKRKANELNNEDDIKKKKSRSNTPKLQTKTMSLKTNTTDTKSKTPNSKPKSPKSKLNKTNLPTETNLPNKKDTQEITKESMIIDDDKIPINNDEIIIDEPSTLQESHDINEEKQNENINPEENEKKSQEMTHSSINENEKSNTDEIKHENEKRYGSKNEDEEFEIETSKSKKKYLNEDQILKKIKNNESRYESNFPKDYLKKSNLIETKKDDSRVDDSDKDEEEDKKQRKLNKLKLQRIEKLKRDEKDRQIVKDRHSDCERANEKERINKKMKLQQLEDHKFYLKELKKNKRDSVQNLAEKSKDQKDKGVEKLPKIIFDYQKLVLESKNRGLQMRNPNLYRVKNIDYIDIKIERTDIEEKQLVVYNSKNSLQKDLSLPEYKSEGLDFIDTDKKFNENIKESSQEDKVSNEKENLFEIKNNEEKIINDNEEVKNKDDVIEQKIEDDNLTKDIEDQKKVKNETLQELEKVSTMNINDQKNQVSTEVNKYEMDDNMPSTSQINESERKKKKFKSISCFGKKSKFKKGASDVADTNLPSQTIFDNKSSEFSSEEEREELLVTNENTEEVHTEIPIKCIAPEVESDEDKGDFIIPENDINNPKFWKRNIYYVELKALYERKIACIIRAKPGQIPKRKMIICELILSSDELPTLDQREDYTNYIFKIYPRDEESASQICFDVPWHIAIPYYLPESSSKKPLIMQMTEDQNRWIECCTYDTIFDNLKDNTLKFVETKIQKPFGTYAVVSFLNKDRTIVDKEGTQLTSTSDGNIMLNVPADAIRISINTSLKVTCLDPIFWKEIKKKHEKSALDYICASSAVVEIEAKKKKLTKPATLTLTLPNDIPKARTPILKKKETLDSEYMNSKLDEDKNLPEKKILNSFQKTLLMPNVNSAQNMQDMHFLSYINEEERWNIIENPTFNYDKSKEQIQVELPAIQSSKYILLKSKRKTNDEAITKAAKIIDNELCVRNCVIALMQSSRTHCDFALIISLKKYFQHHVNNLQDEGFIMESSNKLINVELKERQIITMEFVGNIQNTVTETNTVEFAFQSLFPNTQKFRVREIDSFAQKAVTTFRGYVDLSTKSHVKKPIQSTEGKIRKNAMQYSVVEENILLCHLLISIKKGKIPRISPFLKFKFQFRKFRRCLDIIKKVSSKIGVQWWELGLLLNITETRMHSIKLHNQDKGFNKLAEQMLYFWLRGCETNENKYDLLATALKNCNRFDIVDHIQKPHDRHLIFGC